MLTSRPFLAFASPRKLPKPRELQGRVVVLDEGKAIDVPNGISADEYDNRLPL